MFEKFIYFFYPKTCMLCDKKISENLSYTCEKCSNIIKYSMRKGVVKHYGDTYFAILISPFLYDGIIRKKILEFKFYDRAYLGKLFASLLYEYLLEIKLEADIIIPVPMYYKRRLKRGYNQSSILARELSQKLEMKYESNVLIKARKSAVQSTLDLYGRMRNVLGTFEIKNARKIYDKKILLIDDVFTTGATVNECSKVLKENGAKQIIVVTIAHGRF